MTRSPPASISVFNYDDDFFAWTQEQAAALRRLPNEAVGDAIDIAHVADEIEDLGSAIFARSPRSWRGCSSI